MRSLWRLATLPVAYLLLAGGVAAVTFGGEVKHPLLAWMGEWVHEVLSSSATVSGGGPVPAEAQDVLPRRAHADEIAARGISGGGLANRGAGFSVAAPTRYSATLRPVDAASAPAAVSAASLPNASAPLVANRATASREVSAAPASSAQAAVAPVNNAAATQALYVDTANPGQGGVYAGATYNVSNGDAYTNVYDGYSGTGTITHSSGTLTIPASGSLYIGYNSGSNGSYSLSGTGNLSTGTVYVGNSGTGTFNQSGGSFTTNAAALNVAYNSGSSGTYNLSGATSTLYANGITIGSSGAGTFTQSGGLFSSDSNTLTLGVNGTGSGTYVLSGGNLYADVVVIGSAGMGTFTQSGGTFVNAGSVTLGSAAGGSGTYTLSGGTLDVAGISGGSGTSTFNFSGGTLQADGSSTSFFAGLSVADIQASGARIDTADSNVTIAQNLVSGTATGTLDGGLNKLGSGTLTLSGTNTYTGPTSVSVGVLEAAGAASLPGYNSAGRVTVSSGATLAASVGGAGQWTAADLDTLRANVTFNSGAALGIDTASATGPFSYASSVSGSLGLAKLGAGTLTLMGANAYTGATTIVAGTLQIGNGGTSGSLGTGSVSNNAALVFDRSDPVNVANTISGTGSLTQAGAGTVTLTGVSTYTGGTNVSAGTLTFGAGSSFTGAGTINVAGGAALNINGNVNAGQSAVEVNATGGGVATVTLGSGGTLAAVDSEYVGYNGSGTFTQTAGSNSTFTYGSVLVGANSGSSGTYNLSGGSLSTYTEFVGYNGNGMFVQSGGTNTLSNDLYIGYYAGSSGSYALNGGTLAAFSEYIGYGTSGSFTQSAGTNTVPFNGGAVVVGLHNGDNDSYVLSGSGVLSTPYEYVGDSGAGTFTQTGGTNAVGNQLSMGDNATGNGTYNLNGGKLQAPSIAGNSGASTFNFNGGTVQAEMTNTSFVSGLTTANVQTGGAKIDTNGYNVTISQPLVHDTTSSAPAIDGGLTKLGMGMLTLAAANTYTGTTTVDVGTLAVSVNGGLGKGNVTIAAGATLSLGTGVTAAHNASIGTTLTLTSTTTSLVNLAGTGVQDTVTSLIINGITEPNGTYGAPGSGAAHTGLADFTGTGELSVVPEPCARVLLTGAGLLLVVAVRRQRAA